MFQHLRDLVFHTKPDTFEVCIDHGLDRPLCVSFVWMVSSRSHNLPPVVPHTVAPILDKLRVPKNPGPLAGETIWYRDLGRKQLHSELVRGGMERAGLSGKRVGRPRVSDELGFTDRFDEALKRIATGELSRRKAAQELQISYSTLKRLLDGRNINV